MKPRLLDLFCGAGGASMGYRRAGFDVVGVDIKPQPRYPFEFHQADALAFPLEGFDAIHASPVCKGWTRAKHIHGHKDWYPMDQVAETRARLQSSGLPYVIENVIGAPLMNPILLCGLMFGLRVLRHRHFESNLLFPRPNHPRHVGTTNSHRGMGKGGELVCVAGHNFLMSEASEAMGIDWMVQAEISQAIPPRLHRVDRTATAGGHPCLKSIRSSARGAARSSTPRRRRCGSAANHATTRRGWRCRQSRRSRAFGRTGGSWGRRGGHDL